MEPDLRYRSPSSPLLSGGYFLRRGPSIDRRVRGVAVRRRNTGAFPADPDEPGMSHLVTKVSQAWPEGNMGKKL